MDFYTLSKKNRSEFIKSNKNFIYNTVLEMVNKNLDWKKSEELNIGIFAFNYACNSYFNELENGNLFNYARVLIHSYLLDYFTKASYTPTLRFNNSLNTYNDKNIQMTAAEKEAEAKIYQNEIIALNEFLFNFNLNYSNLAKNCPHNNTIKNKLLNIAFLCSNELFILNLIEEKKMLPAKKISLFTKCDINLIERWQNYLLILIIIFSDKNLIYLKSYLNICVGDTK